MLNHVNTLSASRPVAQALRLFLLLSDMSKSCMALIACLGSSFRGCSVWTGQWLVVFGGDAPHVGSVSDSFCKAPCSVSSLTVPPAVRHGKSCMSLISGLESSFGGCSV